MDSTNKHILNKAKSMENINLKELISLNRIIVPNPKITIDLTQTHQEIIEQVSTQIQKWTPYQNSSQKNEKTLSNCNLIWNDDYISEDWLKKMLPYQKINHFPGSMSLGKKHNLGVHLNKMKKEFPSEQNFFPKTQILPFQYEELRNACVECGFKKTQIVKPGASCQGKGIFLTTKLDKISKTSDHQVVQEQITQPFLIDQLKFDLRIQVLLKSINPMKIYMQREGLARFATEDYQKPKKSNFNNLQMHLTNQAINKKNPNFVYNDNPETDQQGHKRSFTSILKILNEMGQDVESLMNSIKQLIVKTIISVLPIFQNTQKINRPCGEDLDLCFEIFGFDILIDKKLNPWLLEVNHTPSFTTDTPLDYEIKKNLIIDTLNLLKISENTKKSLFLLFFNQFRYLTKNSYSPSIHRKKIVHNNYFKQKDEIDDENLGGYQLIYPSNIELTQIYENFIQGSNTIWNKFFGLVKKSHKQSMENSQNMNKKPWLKHISNSCEQNLQRPKTAVIISANRNKNCFSPPRRNVGNCSQGLSLNNLDKIDSKELVNNFNNFEKINGETKENYNNFEKMNKQSQENYNNFEKTECKDSESNNFQVKSEQIINEKNICLQEKLRDQNLKEKFFKEKLIGNTEQIEEITNTNSTKSNENIKEKQKLEWNQNNLLITKNTCNLQGNKQLEIQQNIKEKIINNEYHIEEKVSENETKLIKCDKTENKSNSEDITNMFNIKKLLKNTINSHCPFSLKDLEKAKKNKIFYVIANKPTASNLLSNSNNFSKTSYPVRDAQSDRKFTEKCLYDSIKGNRNIIKEFLSKHSAHDIMKYTKIPMYSNDFLKIENSNHLVQKHVGGWKWKQRKLKKGKKLLSKTEVFNEGDGDILKNLLKILSNRHKPLLIKGTTIWKNSKENGNEE